LRRESDRGAAVAYSQTWLRSRPLSSGDKPSCAIKLGLKASSRLQAAMSGWPNAKSE
jgi:hypothetical protein